MNLLRNNLLSALSVPYVGISVIFAVLYHTRPEVGTAAISITFGIGSIVMFVMGNSDRAYSVDEFSATLQQAVEKVEALGAKVVEIESVARAASKKAGLDSIKEGLGKHLGSP